jgi:hypothetical protein
VTACPRCGGGVAATQEYCLECGLGLPGRGRLGPPPLRRRSVALPLLAAALVAAGGAGAAIAVTWDGSGDGQVLVATGGSERPPTPDGRQTAGRPARLAAWPRGRDGWTITIVSIPKERGRERAAARARLALERGLPAVGIIDSDETAGLQPGYWVVFTGVYETKPEATSDLLRARTFAKTAAARRISG